MDLRWRMCDATHLSRSSSSPCFFSSRCRACTSSLRQALRCRFSECRACSCCAAVRLPKGVLRPSRAYFGPCKSRCCRESEEHGTWSVLLLAGSRFVGVHSRCLNQHTCRLSRAVLVRVCSSLAVAQASCNCAKVDLADCRYRSMQQQRAKDQLDGYSFCHWQGQRKVAGCEALHYVLTAISSMRRAELALFSAATVFELWSCISFHPRLRCAVDILD
jgi:hypothetical protein